MIFRTVLVQDGNLINWENQLEQLARDLGFRPIIPPFTIPQTGTHRLRITVAAETLIEIEPYSPPSRIRLTLYPEPIDGPSIKTSLYRSRQYIRDYARSQGCDDALLFASSGHLTEASNANFFFKHEGKYYTPDPSLPYLFGLTIRSLPHPFTYIKIKPHELPHEAEIFLCNSLMGVVSAFFYH